jgi:hypothetical protein
MHRAATGQAGRHEAPPPDGFRCSCAGQAQALIGQVTPAAELPPAIRIAAPPVRDLAYVVAPASITTTGTTPPAPPPRA